MLQDTCGCVRASWARVREHVRGWSRCERIYSYTQHWTSQQAAPARLKEARAVAVWMRLCVCIGPGVCERVESAALGKSWRVRKGDRRRE